MAPKKKKNDGPEYAAQNRQARYNYEVLEDWQAGIVLTSSEVKSLRAGQANISDAYAQEQGGEIWLLNAHISSYKQAGRFNHEPERPRKLLLHRIEVNKIIGRLHNQGLTLVPLSIYWNKRGIAKVHLALAKGKSKYDKRQSEKHREWEREKSRMMKESE
ncbi:MAG: SsrA-binding protein SmpB [Proteobacteria bacterium]|nr:SsrA-binding protein SmpB [Pseudomonadota bacterium]